MQRHPLFRWFRGVVARVFAAEYGADEVATNPDCYTNGLTGGGRDAGETIIVDGRK